ncbi:suppressor of SWI4 1 homolog [Anomalospiza imberbis]|uniref:suppressor of SWI4 1 homolog n=1 Tax=Anomalospiza imberbis TaxID=187417 RepID=UPI00358F9088
MIFTLFFHDFSIFPGFFMILSLLPPVFPVFSHDFSQIPGFFPQSGNVQVVPVGLSRGLQKILQEKFLNLARMDDISQLLTGDVALSESKAEPDGSQNILERPQNCAGRGNTMTQQSAMRLTEDRPRLTLQLLKVEEGLGQGNVLYHGLAPKGEAELRELLAWWEQRLQVRVERCQAQEQNLERKQQQREWHR